MRSAELTDHVDLDGTDPALDDAAVPEPNASVSAFGRTFHALATFPEYRKLWGAAFASSLGQWMQSTALGWLAFELTDSKSFVGYISFAAGLPFLVVALPGGLLVDRFDRRRLLLTCQCAAVLLALLVAVDVVSGAVEAWHLLIAAFLNGSLQAILAPTQQSLVPALVPRASLTNAIELIGAGANMTRVFGPSLAGAVIGFVGTGEAFLLQAAALVVAFALVLTTRFERASTGTASGFRNILSGLQIVRARADLRGLMLLAAIPCFTVFPYISFLPVFARDVLDTGPQGLGLLLASSGVGAVVGGLVVAGARRQSGHGRALVTTTLVYCGAIALFAASAKVWISMPVLVVAGLLGSYYMSSNNALIQHRVTDDIRGRVMGTYMLTWGLMPLGALPMGMVAEQVGVRAATAAGALLSALLIALLAVRNREIFRL